MTLPAFAQIAAVIATLTFNCQISKSQDARLAEELKCLKVKPGEQCNLTVTYADPLKTVKCGMVVPESQEQALSQPPTLSVVTPPGVEDELDAALLLLMFDPDAPVSTNPADGFNHWVAVTTLLPDGKLEAISEDMEYYPPSPPKNDGPHRYQFFLFPYVEHDPLELASNRQLQLCPFMKKYNLGAPYASTEFVFEHGKKNNGNCATTVTPAVVTMVAIYYISVHKLLQAGTSQR